jgi:oligopeptide/dipeptide ABC transporter ATP-binding protein
VKLLEVTDLQVHFPVARGWLRKPVDFVRAVDGVNLDLAPGETLGLVGESGCGKTTLGRAIVRLLKPTHGRIRFNGVDLVPLEGHALRRQRRHFQMIFQDPAGSLDPRLTIESIVGEPLDIHRLSRGRTARHDRISQLLSDVGLDPSLRDRYPHEFSGGQRQRIGIARALAVEPQLIVCDEPVSALDVSVQAQVVNLLHDLQEQRQLAFLFIAHDLAVVEHLSHRIAVMYLGNIIETGPARSVTRLPRHPYTQALISAVPTPDPLTRRPRLVLGGEVPSPIHPPKGCPFHPRCPIAETRCRYDPPVPREILPEHWVACHLAK